MTSRQISLKSFVGLMLALFSLPLISLVFQISAPLNPGQTVLREGVMFLSGAFLLLFAFRFETSSWQSLGLGRHTLVETAFIVLVGLVLMLLVIWINDRLFGMEQVLSIQGVDAQSRPMWLLALISLRAGVLEELMYRAYAINRLEFLTGNRWLAVMLPLLVFTLVHSPQGLRGISLALMAGVVLTAIYLWKRNLWACMTIHFLVDYAPNALLGWYRF